MSENQGVGGKEQQRRRQRYRREQAARSLVKPLERPDRFQHADRRGCSRRTLVIAVMLILVAALIIPTVISLNLVGKSVPSITQQPGSGARLVPDDPVVTDTRVLTRRPQ